MPAMRWIIDTAAAMGVLVARHGSVLIVVMIVAPIAAALLMRTPNKSKPFPRAVRLFIPALIVAAILNLIYGERLANALINVAGVAGEAQVTSAWTTNETNNYRDVIGYAVLIRKADGHSVLAGMKSDTFNIYPSGRGVRTGEGARFRVRYLRTYPALFIVLEG
jgi:hypothetical protein